MRNSPNGQILGQPNTGIPRRALWWLASLVGLAHAALLVDPAAIDLSESSQTQLAQQTLSSPTEPDDTRAQAPDRPSSVHRVRWLGERPNTLATKGGIPASVPRAPEPTRVVEPEPIVAVIESASPVSHGLAVVDSPAADHTSVLSAPALGVAPTHTRLVYDIIGEVKGRNIFAEGRFEWTVEAERYDAMLEVRMVLLGKRTQTSIGRIGPQGLMPERFGERQRDEAATHFDHEGQRVRFSRNRPDATLLPGTQDRLSVILQLAARLQAQPTLFASGQGWEVPVASSRDVTLWRWTVGQIETVELPKGHMRALHFTRPPLHEHDQTIELWMAPELQHLPVRIRISQANGDWLDQRLVLAP